MHSNLIKEILCALSKRVNIRAWRNETGVARSFDGQRTISYGLKGSADIIGIAGPSGRMLCIECKVGRDRQSDEQKNFERMIAERGGVYILARSAGEVSERLDKLGL